MYSVSIRQPVNLEIAEVRQTPEVWLPNLCIIGRDHLHPNQDPKQNLCTQIKLEISFSYPLKHQCGNSLSCQFFPKPPYIFSSNLRWTALIPGWEPKLQILTALSRGSHCASLYPLISVYEFSALIYQAGQLIFLRWKNVCLVFIPTGPSAEPILVSLEKPVLSYLPCTLLFRNIFFDSA